MDTADVGEDLDQGPSTTVAPEPEDPRGEGLILVVDDEPDIALLIEQNLLADGFKVEVVHDGEAALEAAGRLLPDLILLDVMMPGLDGYAVCERLRSDARTSNVLVIMITAGSQSSDKVLGLSAGADDYITKPFDTMELLTRVRVALRRSRAMRAVSPLTGLAGNIQIQERLAQLVAAGTAFSLLYADLDNFKAYNDHYGFVRGDGVIQLVGRILTEASMAHAGPEGFVGHIGGDDFILIVPEAAADDAARAVIERFDQEVAALYDPRDLEAGGLVVPDRQGEMRRYPMLSISIGGVCAGQRAFAHPGEVVAVANEMKQFAKREPRSSYAFDRRAG